MADNNGFVGTTPTTVNYGGGSSSTGWMTESQNAGVSALSNIVRKKSSSKSSSKEVEQHSYDTLFGNKDAVDWISKKYIEDQVYGGDDADLYRKQNQMISATSYKKYDFNDSGDKQLYDAKLPSAKELGNYVELYNEHVKNVSAKNDFYSAVAKAETELKYAGVYNDDSVYDWDTGKKDEDGKPITEARTGSEIYAEKFFDILNNEFSDMVDKYQYDTTDTTEKTEDDFGGDYTKWYEYQLKQSQKKRKTEDLPNDPTKQSKTSSPVTADESEISYADYIANREKYAEVYLAQKAEDVFPDDEEDHGDKSVSEVIDERKAAIKDNAMKPLIAAYEQLDANWFGGLFDPWTKNTAKQQETYLKDHGHEDWIEEARKIADENIERRKNPVNKLSDEQHQGFTDTVQKYMAEDERNPETGLRQLKPTVGNPYEVTADYVSLEAVKKAVEQFRFSGATDDEIEEYCNAFAKANRNELSEEAASYLAQQSAERVAKARKYEENKKADKLATDIADAAYEAMVGGENASAYKLTFSTKNNNANLPENSISDDDAYGMFSGNIRTANAKLTVFSKEKSYFTEDSLDDTIDKMIQAGATAEQISSALKRYAEENGVNLADIYRPLSDTFHGNGSGIDAYIREVAGSQKEQIDQDTINSAVTDVVRKQMRFAGYSEFDIDQTIRRMGDNSSRMYTLTLDDTDSARNYYKEKVLLSDEAIANEYAQLPVESQKDFLDKAYKAYVESVGGEENIVKDFTRSKPFNVDLDKSIKEQLGATFVRVFSQASANILNGYVSAGEMGWSWLTRSTEKTDFGKRMDEMVAEASNIGRTANQGYGSDLINIGGDIASELVRMYALNSFGSMTSDIAEGLIGETSWGSKALEAMNNVRNARSDAAEKGLKGVAKIRKVSEVQSAGLGRIISASQKIIQSKPFITTAMGNYYSEAVTSGYNPTVGQATAYALVCGTLEGAVEFLQLDSVWGKALGEKRLLSQLKDVRNTLKISDVNAKLKLINLATSFLGEAGEEGISYLASIGMQKLTYNKDAFVDGSELFNQALIGGLTGLAGSALRIKGVNVQSFLEEHGVSSSAGGYGYNDILASVGYTADMSEAELAQRAASGKILSTNEFSSKLNTVMQAEGAVAQAEETIGRLEARKQIADKVAADAEATANNLEQQALLNPAIMPTATEMRNRASEALEKARKIADELKTAQTDYASAVSVQNEAATKKAYNDIANHCARMKAIFEDDFRKMASNARAELDLSAVNEKLVQCRAGNGDVIYENMTNPQDNQSVANENTQGNEAQTAQDVDNDERTVVNNKTEGEWKQEHENALSKFKRKKYKDGMKTLTYQTAYGDETITAYSNDEILNVMEDIRGTELEDGASVKIMYDNGNVEEFESGEYFDDFEEEGIVSVIINNSDGISVSGIKYLSFDSEYEDGSIDVDFKSKNYDPYEGEANPEEEAFVDDYINNAINNQEIKGNGAKPNENLRPIRSSQFYEKMAELESVPEVRSVNEAAGAYVENINNKEIVTNKDSLKTASDRLKVDFTGEMEDLGGRMNWSQEDIDTAMGILYTLREEGLESGDMTEYVKWLDHMTDVASDIGGALQAFAKYTGRTVDGVILEARQKVRQAEEEATAETIDGKRNTKRDRKKADGVKEGREGVNRAKEEGRTNAEEKTLDVIRSLAETQGDDSGNNNGRGRRSDGTPADEADNDFVRRTVASRIINRVRQKMAQDVSDYVNRHPSTEVTNSREVAISEIVNELFGTAVRSPIEGAEDRSYKETPEEKLARLNKLAEQYKEEFNAVREYVYELVQNDPAAVADFDQFFGNGEATRIIMNDRLTAFYNNDNPSFVPESVMKAVYKNAKQEIGADISKIVVADSKSKADTRQRLVDYLREQDLVTDSTAEQTAKAITDLYDAELKEATTNYLKRMFAEKAKSSDPTERHRAKKALDVIAEIENAVAYIGGYEEEIARRLPEDLRKVLTESGVRLTNTSEQTEKPNSVSLAEIIAMGQDATDEQLAKYISEVSGANVDAIQAQQLIAVATQVFEDAVASEKNAYAQKLVEKFNRSTEQKVDSQNKRSDIEEVIRAINMGAYDASNVDGAVLQANGLPSLTQRDIVNLQQNIQLAEQESDDYMKKVYYSRAAQIIANKTVAKASDRLNAFRRTMMLLNSKTMIKNVSANVPMAGLESAKDIVGTGIDYVVSKFTGKRTTNAFAKGKTAAYLKGFKQGVVDSINDFKYGVNTEWGKGRYEQNAANGIDFGEGRFADILNKLQDVTGHLMQFGDRPFAESAYQARIVELASLGYDVSSKDVQDGAIAYALDRVFQNNSALAKRAAQVRNDLGEIGRIVMPFVQTPANIADKLFDYSPASLIRLASQIGTSVKTGNFDQKLFVDRLSRFVTGTGILLLGRAMKKAGILTGGSNNEKESMLFDAAGVEEYALKIGNSYFTVDWAEPAGSLLVMGAELSDELAKIAAGDSTVGTALVDTAQTGINVFFNNSFLSTLSDLISGNSSVGEAVTDTARNAVTQYTPTAFAQIARVFDDYDRDTYDPDPLLQTGKQVFNRIPILRSTLAKKVDSTGNEKTNSAGTNWMQRMFNTMLLPAYFSTRSDDAVSNELYDLYSAGYEEAILPTAPKSLNGVKFNSTERREYRELLGQTCYAAVESLMKTSSYKRMTESQKADAIEEAISKASSKARKSWYAKHPEFKK